jgi:uncharacterized protein
MIERLYLRLFDRFWGRPRLLLAFVALALLLATPALYHVRLDMSFRPLFAHGDVEAAATHEFEAVFGQPSGAFIGAILEPGDPLRPSFLRRLDALTHSTEALEGVREVVSLTRAPVAAWTADGPTGALLIPPALLEQGREEVLKRHLTDPRVQEGLRTTLLSPDGTRTILLARLEAPLEDLASRRAVIRDFRALVTASIGSGEAARFVGVSVVEEAYAGLVLRSLAVSFLLTTVALLGILWLVFRRVAAVLVVMAGVGMAIPISVALLTAIGQDLTMINSMVPVLILIIGVADAIHMLRSYTEHLGRGLVHRAAVRGMFGEMAVPCMLTTLTTMAGFLSLRLAHLTAIRDFGLSVAIGTAVVYLLNFVLVPLFLAAIPPSRVVRERGRPAGADGAAGFITSLVIRWPGPVVAVSMLAVIAAAASLPDLRMDQRFNEEVRAEHPLRADQALVERDFGGFLGPEVEIARRDGGALLRDGDLEALSAYVAAVGGLPGVLRVESLLDHLPADASSGDAAEAARLRSDPLLGPRMRELVNPGGDRAALHVRTGDLGTRRAAELGGELRELAAFHLGDVYEMRVVGQWWLAQRGMDNLLRDMLTSFFVSCLLILPMAGLFLRDARLLLVGALPNLIPVVFALAFMVWAGISLRIGTAMVLAIALAIGIDDTVHLLARLRREAETALEPTRAVSAALAGTGTAIAQTTLVLVVGFLSMLSSDLLAIREMGLVAAVALTVALLADLVFAPALYLLVARSKRTLAVDAVAGALSTPALQASSGS